MKTTTISACLIVYFSAFSAYAGTPHFEKTLFQALVEINPRWQTEGANNPELLKKVGEINRYETLKLHLQLVEERLRQKPVAETLKAPRNRNLNLVAEYREAGRFPRNDYVGQASPVIMDMDGEIDVVAYLLSQNDGRESVLQLSSCCNHTLIENFPAEVVNAYVAKSGLTLDELSWLQPRYAATTEWRTLAEDQPVVVDSALVAATEAELALATLGGGLQPEELMVFGNIPNSFQADWKQLNGRLLSAALYQDQIFVCTNEIENDSVSVYKLVVWNGKKWRTVRQFEQNQMAVTLIVYKNELYVGGSQRVALESSGEMVNAPLLNKWNGQKWTSIKSNALGGVFCFAVHNNQLLAGAIAD